MADTDFDISLCSMVEDLDSHSSPRSAADLLEGTPPGNGRFMMIKYDAWTHTNDGTFKNSLELLSEWSSSRAEGAAEDESAVWRRGDNKVAGPRQLSARICRALSTAGVVY